MIAIICEAELSAYIENKGTSQTRSIMSSWSWKSGIAVAAIVAATAYALAQMPGHEGMHRQMGPGGPNEQQTMPPQGGMQRMHGPMMHQMMMSGMHGSMQGGPQGMHGGMGMGQHGMHGGMMQHGTGQQTGLTGQPTMPGQDAFGTIQEIVRMLEADPATNWSKVNIAALREHLIDMNEVTLHAVATQRDLDNGVEIAVTSVGRTLEAIKRMVPAHASTLAQTGWNAKTEDLPNGVTLTVTTNDANQTTKLKALGFMGIMVQGGHHRPHHLMMAKGEPHVH
jgi:hypothetical protein